MTTDLRTALREAVGDAPTQRLDAQSVIRAGARRVRRRTRIAVGTSAAAVVAAALVTVAVVVSTDDAGPKLQPADIVRLDLERVEPAQLDVLATTKHEDERSSPEPNRYEGITDDGLVLASRHTRATGVVELGLLDPRTGATEWLPAPPVVAWDFRAVRLTSERLVAIVRTGVYQHAVLVFDRASQVWHRKVVKLPDDGIEVHIGPQTAISPDDRLYLGNTMENESGPMRWWSVPVTGDASDPRPEQTLEGSSVAWGNGVRVTADPSGHVVLSGPQGELVVSDDRPADCERPEAFPEWPVGVMFAGDRPVVTYVCQGEVAQMTPSHTVIYDDGGHQVIDIPNAVARAADDHHVVLARGGPITPSDGTGDTEDSGTYVVDLERLTVRRIGAPPSQLQAAVVDGLVMWDAPGPREGRRVVWNVAQID